MIDIDDIRRANLRLLEASYSGPAEAAAAVGMSTAQFINLRDGAKDSKTGKPRGMRKDTARRIEAAAGKPTGWLDAPPATPPLTGTLGAVAAGASDPVLGAAASATTSAIDLASQAAEIGRMWLLLPEARRKKVKAALERELSHSNSEHTVIPATEKSRENATQLPDSTGHRTLFLDSVGEQKKSPEKDAGEG